MFPGDVGAKKTNRRLSVALILMALLVFASVTIKAQAKSASESASAAQVFEALNAARASQGLSALTWDETLSACAAVRAQEISVCFSHSRPDGSAWFTVNPDVQYGENLMYTTYAADAWTVLNTWASSPAHYALFFDPFYRTAAVARYESGGCNYWVIEFGY